MNHQLSSHEKSHGRARTKGPAPKTASEASEGGGQAYGCAGRQGLRFDTDLPRLDPYAPWMKLFEPQFPDTENYFTVKFQQTFDEVHGRKINPIEALGICMKCGKVNKSFDQGILCNCEGGSRKRKYKDDAGKLAALMGK